MTLISVNWIILAGMVYILGSALLNRWRGNGGTWGPAWSHTIKRVIVSIWLALPFAFLPEAWQYFATASMIMVIGFLPGWGTYFDFANPPEPEIRWIDKILKRLSLGPVENDLVGMSLRGLHFTVPVATFVAAAVFPSIWLIPLAGSGMLMGLIYWAFFEFNIPGDRIAYSEYVWGGILACIYLMMMEVTL